MIGVYIRLKANRGTFVRKGYGCSDHNVYAHGPVCNYCPTCGKPMGEVEQTYEGYPEIWDAIGGQGKLRVHHVLNSDMFYIFSWNRDDSDGTTIDTYTQYSTCETIITSELISNAVDRFKKLYEEEINIINKFGEAEIHFGIINTDR
jgi:hypothetical protein